MNIYEVAERAGVSIATVSRVINRSAKVSSATRAKVEKVLEEMEYTPSAVARSLATNATRLVGILCSDNRDPAFAESIFYAEQTLAAEGYDCLMGNATGDLKQKDYYIKGLLERKADGVLMFGASFEDEGEQNLLKLAAKRMPVVMVASTTKAKEVYQVTSKEDMAVASIVKGLALSGHKHFAYLYDATSPSARIKLNGFERGLEESGLGGANGAAVRVAKGFHGGFTGARWLIDHGLFFTALLTSEDALAAGALKALIQSGRRVPDDVCVFGHNNSELCLCTAPSLSSVDNRMEELARLGVRTLQSAMNSSKKPLQVAQIPAKIVQRDSSVPFDVE